MCECVCACVHVCAPVYMLMLALLNDNRSRAVTEN